MIDLLRFGEDSPPILFAVTRRARRGERATSTAAHRGAPEGRGARPLGVLASHKLSKRSPGAANCSGMQRNVRSVGIATDGGLTRSTRSNAETPTNAKNRVRSGP